MPSLPVPSLCITALPCGPAVTNFGTLQASGPACKLRSTLKLSRHATNFLCSFVEGYVTIIVSCAPAASSFWANYFTKSEVYSVLKSSLRLLISTHSKVSRATSSNSHESRVPRVEFRTNLVHGKNSYIELENSANQGPRTNIFSRGPVLGTRRLAGQSSLWPASEKDRRLFHNTNVPFSAFICGLQGSGKSHILSYLLGEILCRSFSLLR